MFQKTHRPKWCVAMRCYFIKKVTLTFNFVSISVLLVVYIYLVYTCRYIIHFMYLIIPFDFNKIILIKLFYVKRFIIVFFKKKNFFNTAVSSTKVCIIQIVWRMHRIQSACISRKNRLVYMIIERHRFMRFKSTFTNHRHSMY